VGLQRPELTIAHGIIESNLNPRAIGKMKEKGAWQVREKFWGKVPDDIFAQAKQHERILNTLIKESNNDLSKAISRYNGKGRKAQIYAKKVIRKTFELHFVNC
jgi:hypothetical protein